MKTSDRLSNFLVDYDKHISNLKVPENLQMALLSSIKDENIGRLQLLPDRLIVHLKFAIDWKMSLEKTRKHLINRDNDYHLLPEKIKNVKDNVKSLKQIQHAGDSDEANSFSGICYNGVCYNCDKRAGHRSGECPLPCKYCEKKKCNSRILLWRLGKRQ